MASPKIKYYNYDKEPYKNPIQRNITRESPKRKNISTVATYTGPCLDGLAPIVMQALQSIGYDYSRLYEMREECIQRNRLLGPEMGVALFYNTVGKILHIYP